jgi:hypothetical protein
MPRQKVLVIGCPLGHAASGSDGVSAVMKEKAFKPSSESILGRSGVAGV